MAKGDSSGGSIGGQRNPMMGGGGMGMLQNPNMDFLQQLFGGILKGGQGMQPGKPPPGAEGFLPGERPNIGPYPIRMPHPGGGFAPLPPGSFPDPMGKGSNHPSSSSWRNSPWVKFPINTMGPQSDPTQGGTLVNNGWGKMVPRAQMEELYRRGGMT
jgi:hypothetical protein